MSLLDCFSYSISVADEEESYLLNATFLSPEEETGYILPENMTSYNHHQHHQHQPTNHGVNHGGTPVTEVPGSSGRR
jgi:hypothetical protein